MACQILFRISAVLFYCQLTGRARRPLGPSGHKVYHLAITRGGRINPWRPTARFGSIFGRFETTSDFASILASILGPLVVAILVEVVADSINGAEQDTPQCGIGVPARE